MRSYLKFLFYLMTALSFSGCKLASTKAQETTIIVNEKYSKSDEASIKADNTQITPEKSNLMANKVSILPNQKHAKVNETNIKPEERKIVQKFATAGNYTHYRIDCRIYDLDGVLIRKIPGWFCHFFENGETLVSDGNTLEKYDKSLKKLWSQPIPVNHQIALSELNNQILTISSEYDTGSDKILRTDKVLILSEDGKILKSFSFRNYARSHPGNPLIFNDWTEDKYSGKSYEETHVNSFKEIFKTEYNKKVLIGYVAYCLKDQRIYFLDKELKKITRVLSSGGRTLHELHQISESELIYYQNQQDGESIKLSSIGTFNLNSEKFTNIYENKDPQLFSFACSSVQALPGNKLFIFHSSCRVKWTPHSGALEFVDLNTHERLLRMLPYSQGYAQHAFLINAKNYLKNSVGY